MRYSWWCGQLLPWWCNSAISTLWNEYLCFPRCRKTITGRSAQRGGRKGLPADSASLRAAHLALWNPVWECSLVTRSGRQDPAQVYVGEWSVHKLISPVPGAADTVHVCPYFAKLPTQLKLTFRLLSAKGERQEEQTRRFWWQDFSWDPQSLHWLLLGPSNGQTEGRWRSQDWDAVT